MELFEQIRREYEFGIGTISGVSRKLQVHRRLVREALSSAVPAERKPQERQLRKLAAASAFIDRILIADRQAPPKQRHTARRIWQQLCAELPGFRSSPAVANGVVYFGSGDGNLYALDASAKRILADLNQASVIKSGQRLTSTPT